VRRRYEYLQEFPDGLLVLGDAVCSFNPVYGQGMTVAANQALVLRRLLAHHTNLAPARYFRAIAKTINPPWELAVSADLALPGVSVSRTRRIRIANAYLPRLLAAASSDVVLGTAFIRVLGLLDRAEGLLRPDRMLRMWWVTRGKVDAAIGSNAIKHNRDAAIRPEVSPWQ
jgi:hypothetical protein